MLVHFMKMHGLGNDFVVLDRITQNLYLNAAQIRRIADRKLGIGCDQVIIVEPPVQPNSDFYYRIFNPDGTEAEQCGNGIRCAARFVYDAGLIKKTSLLSDCLAGPIAIRIEKNHLLTVNMGIPKINRIQTASIQVLDKTLPMVAVDLGNPHATILLSDPEHAVHTAPPHWDSLQKAVLDTGLFPEGVNIGWGIVDDAQNVRLSVLERGAGETLACGSAACAVAIAGQKLGCVGHAVNVHFALGRLKISWSGPDTPLFMTGPATSVFQGRFRL